MVREKALDDEQKKLAAILKIYNEQMQKLDMTVSQLNIFKKEVTVLIL